MRLSYHSELLLYPREKSSVGFLDMGLNSALPLCLHKTGNTCWVDWSRPSCTSLHRALWICFSPLINQSPHPPRVCTHHALQECQQLWVSHEGFLLSPILSSSFGHAFCDFWCWHFLGLIRNCQWRVSDDNQDLHCLLKWLLNDPVTPSYVTMEFSHAQH